MEVIINLLNDYGLLATFIILALFIIFKSRLNINIVYPGYKNQSKDD
jgi:hypothetical protein